MKRISFEIKEMKSEKIKWLDGRIEKVETLVCTVTIAAVTKTLDFIWDSYYELYQNKSDKVYVQIPQYGTDRAAVRPDHNLYENKLRGASLHIQKIGDEYRIIERYSILKGQAIVRGWADSTYLKEKYSVATDGNIPTPIKY